MMMNKPPGFYMPRLWYEGKHNPKVSFYFENKKIVYRLQVYNNMQMNITLRFSYLNRSKVVRFTPYEYQQFLLFILFKIRHNNGFRPITDYGITFVTMIMIFTYITI